MLTMEALGRTFLGFSSSWGHQVLLGSWPHPSSLCFCGHAAISISVLDLCPPLSCKDTCDLHLGPTCIIQDNLHLTTLSHTRQNPFSKSGYIHGIQALGHGCFWRVTFQPTSHMKVKSSQVPVALCPAQWLNGSQLLTQQLVHVSDTS